MRLNSFCSLTCSGASLWGSSRLSLARRRVRQIAHVIAFAIVLKLLTKFAQARHVYLRGFRFSSKFGGCLFYLPGIVISPTQIVDATVYFLLGIIVRPRIILGINQVLLRLLNFGLHRLALGCHFQ